MSTKVEYKVKWNTQGCGRCGGSGVYHFACSSGAAKGTCFDCRGRGFRMSPRTRGNMLAFAEWRKTARPTLNECIEALESGRFGWSFKIVKTKTTPTVV